MGQARTTRSDGPSPAQFRLPEGSPSARLGAYLRRLREGYGYTLRKVEEKSARFGEAIDNSQLSRFEKGKALPSFDKLRALARVFNVSVQNFADVLDLEEFESLKPDTRDYSTALAIGEGSYAKGEHGEAFVAFERALEIAESERGGARSERIIEARWRMAACLRSLGKLGMTEHELREILRLGREVARRIRIRVLLQLSSVYRELSDLYLARILAREGLDLAMEEGDLAVQAAVLNTLANITEVDDPVRALPYYQRALELHRSAHGQEEIELMILTNLGGCLGRAHRFEEGLRDLQRACRTARERGFRRVAALALTRMGECWLQRGDRQRAMEAFAESDGLANGSGETYHDILFLNTYRRWETAREDAQGTREKIEFGRLRHLRSLLERRFPEVESFDRYVERHRRSRYEHVS
jgi:transcriptional regulator with XRE-family HTH domain